ncbi:MAG: hypothetical protein WA667_14090 [Candidatus Nitrosopolaris sp.]
MKDNNNVQTVEEMDDDAIKYIEKMRDEIKNVKWDTNSKKWRWWCKII